jgi:hypothetical protein
MISLVLSMVPLILGQMSSAAVINVAIKAAAIILTMKPEIMKIEIMTEDEANSPCYTVHFTAIS